MHFRRKNLKVKTRYNILNFPALFSALVSLPFCPLGRYCWTASAEKSAGKFKMLYIEFWLWDFSPEIHALDVDFWHENSNILMYSSFGSHNTFNETFGRCFPTLWCRFFGPFLTSLLAAKTEKMVFWFKMRDGILFYFLSLFSMVLNSSKLRTPSPSLSNLLKTASTCSRFNFLEILANSSLVM